MLSPAKALDTIRVGTWPSPAKSVHSRRLASVAGRAGAAPEQEQELRQDGNEGMEKF